MATMSLPPVVASLRTTIPCPIPIISEPISVVSIKWSVMFIMPPSSCAGSSAFSAASFGYTSHDMAFMINGVLSAATMVRDPSFEPNSSTDKMSSGMSNI